MARKIKNTLISRYTASRLRFRIKSRLQSQNRRVKIPQSCNDRLNYSRFLTVRKTRFRNSKLNYATFLEIQKTTNFDNIKSDKKLLVNRLRYLFNEYTKLNRTVDEQLNMSTTENTSRMSVETILSKLHTIVNNYGQKIVRSDYENQNSFDNHILNRSRYLVKNNTKIGDNFSELQQLLKSYDDLKQTDEYTTFNNNKKHQKNTCKEYTNVDEILVEMANFLDLPFPNNEDVESRDKILVAVREFLREYRKSLEMKRMKSLIYGFDRPKTKEQKVQDLIDLATMSNCLTMPEAVKILTRKRGQFVSPKSVTFKTLKTAVFEKCRQIMNINMNNVTNNEK